MTVGLGPFFIFLVPVFFVFQGYQVHSQVVQYCMLYFAFVSSFCEFRGRLGAQGRNSTSSRHVKVGIALIQERQ